MLSPLRFLLLPILLAPLACSQTRGPQAGVAGGSGAPANAETRTGVRVFSDWRGDSPGNRYHIRLSDLPTPEMTDADPEASIAKLADVVQPPPGAAPRVPDGFVVSVFARGLDLPRRLRVAPNGDIFLSESGAGRVLVFPASDTGGAASQPHVFAAGLDRPYGIAFLPPANPQYVYVAAANQVVRYPYQAGATQAGGPAEVIIRDLPTKRHWTKDLAVSRDGQRLFLAVGSASNLGGE
jgi:glucose/arabinose dehydrogenase